MNPKTTIVIPTFNREDLVKKSVISSISQTYENIEVLVVDDCSTDNTEAVVRGIGDSRIKYIRLDTNSGPQVARNTGITAATGDYICFLDSDDEYSPDFIKECLEAVKKNPGCSVVYCGYNVIDENGRKLKTFLPAPELKGNLYDYALNKLSLVPTPAFMIAKKCFDKIEFDPRLPSWQDDDLFIKLSRDFEFDIVPHVLYYFRTHKKQRVSTDLKRYAEGHYKLIEIHKNDIQKWHGNNKLARHYLDAAVDYFIAGDRKMFKKICRKCNNYKQVNYVKIIALIIKKYTINYLRNIYYGILGLRARVYENRN